MKSSPIIGLRLALLSGCAAVALTPGLAAAQQSSQAFVAFDIPAQDLDSALTRFGQQSEREIIISSALTRNRQAPAVQGSLTPEAALGLLLADSGLTYRISSAGSIIVEANDPQGGSAAGDGAEGTVEALIVTAQKREEDIQDVPIAISAFTQETLERSQVAGGPDLITQVPNMSFTKTNFSSYSIQLRGIGTQAISATVDPAVAVAFNNTPFIRNRFFEQEFYDLQRVEVLRGPQGTLYGRNATAGVVNLISQKARLDTYEAKLSGDVANYNSTRLEGMVNIPLANDVAALRIAGAWTKREGYSVNELSGEPIDGRDLWSTRVSLRFAPNDRLDANLIWEHFEEDDDRLRSGKQLCDMDLVTEVAGFATPDFYAHVPDFSNHASPLNYVQAAFSQGCKPSSLYAPESFQKTNPLALPYYAPLGAVGLPVARYPVGHPLEAKPIDPYASRTQSHDLRVIEAAVEPGYRAKTDVLELQVAFDLSDTLSLNSETSWASDFIFSTQDYNRFAGAPNSWSTTGNAQFLQRNILTSDGQFCDPQIGCSDRLTAMDLSTARSTQFSQELRLASDFDGPFNFSLGGNFLRYDTEDKYYVFINSLTLISAFQTNTNASSGGTAQWIPGVTDNRGCLANGMVEPDYTLPQRVLQCTYIDPNPIDSLNDLGHNYFLSRNPYKLISYAVFGEAYYNLAENLKVTAGLRWTVDKKEAPQRPSWLLAANTVGHPIHEVVEQEWSKPTGRLAIDWKPDLPFTDETMVYASLAHGYKAGGMNPPPYGKAIITFGIDESIARLVTATSALHPKTFEAEYVDALELGAKNTLLDGALTLNLASFYYDYKGYQLSQIVNRSAVTNNFDATVMGAELEADWRAAENLRFGLKLGYSKTKVADGMRAIDVMDRTAGNDAWTLIRPFPTIPSNCVVPTWMLVGSNGAGTAQLVTVGGGGGGNPGGCELTYLMGLDPAFTLPQNNGNIPPGLQFSRRNIPYSAWSTDLADYPCFPLDSIPTTPIDYPGVDPACLVAASNNGEGFFKDLSGNEFPNAPNFTATLTADYTIPLPSDWLMTLHSDVYYQAESWSRIFNTEGYDKLKAYTNVNLAAIFTNEDAGWKVMAYVKNVFDKDHITGAFLNSDDSGLTTNVFLIEPRLYGLRITKDFAGGPWWTGANLNHEGPFPLTVELGGQVQRHDAPYETMTTPWVATLPAAIALENVQNRDLDVGDGRSLKLTWRPAESPWSVSGAIRYGRTNSDTSRANKSLVEIQDICGYPSGHYLEFFCQGFEYGAFTFEHTHYVETRTWSDAEARSREEHELVDFAVGRDFGLGAGFDTTVSAGIRSARFDSTTSWAANAQSDWDIPQGWGSGHIGPQYESSMTRRQASLASAREFSGMGPVLAWDAALALWGDDQTGRLRVDWSITAGALFGDRETTVSGQDRTVLHQGNLATASEPIFGEKRIITGSLPIVSDEITPISFNRQENATVPLLDLSLGLSYDVGRIKVSTGYRWERYFDVLDVGQDEAAEADRTIDGPYFKLSVGFGG